MVEATQKATVFCLRASLYEQYTSSAHRSRKWFGYGLVSERGKEIRGEARRGEARRGEARRGEARRGEARRGEARRGEARRGEARRGEASQKTSGLTKEPTLSVQITSFERR